MNNQFRRPDLLSKEVADEGLEPPTRFCPVPAYETGEMTNFSNPRHEKQRKSEECLNDDSCRNRTYYFLLGWRML